MNKQTPKLVKAKTCLGCQAYESERFGKGYCSLGFPTEAIETVAGFYGSGKQLIGCRAKPTSHCPKPRTFKLYIKLRLQQLDNHA